RDPPQRAERPPLHPRVRLLLAEGARAGRAGVPRALRGRTADREGRGRRDGRARHQRGRLRRAVGARLGLPGNGSESNMTLFGVPIFPIVLIVGGAIDLLLAMALKVFVVRLGDKADVIRRKWRPVPM